jgi:hypothetical protein
MLIRSWMKARVTAHFWASEWPFELEAGTHTMEVLAEDAHGQDTENPPFL